MVRALFDTNILIDYLNAVPEARVELERFTEKAISIITWMEILIGAAEDFESPTRGFLGGFQVLGVDERIAGSAVNLRRDHRIKLPDAIIWATAQTHSMILVTRNIKDFPPDDPGVRMPYSL
jgi:predicted nucleic acid-binding protein